MNLDEGNALSKAIRKNDSSIGNIRWLSPLKKDEYSELRIDKIDILKTADLSFWPDNGPWWDGIGIDDPTHIKTTEKEWKAHYKDIFLEMLGSTSIPKHVIMINFGV